MSGRLTALDLHEQSSDTVAAGGDFGADGRRGAGVFVQTNVHGNGLHYGCNCLIRARITLRAMNSG
jgi:hypothetical protein